MEEADEIIAGLYEAAALPDHWGDALGAVASFTLSKTAHLATWDSATKTGAWGAIGWVPGAGVDPAADDVYRAYYAQVDPRRPLLQNAIGTVWNRAESLDDGAVPDAREIYHDFLVPNGLRWTMCLTAHRPGGGFLTLASVRGLSEGAYGVEEKRRLAHIAPHLSQVYRLRTRLSETSGKAGMALGAIERLAIGIVVCDAASRIRYANPAARRAAVGKGLTLNGGRVGSDRAEIAALLAGHIRAAATPLKGRRCGIGQTLRIRRDRALGDLFVFVAPLPAEATPNGVPSAPAALLFIETGPVGSAPLGRHLTEWFGLTAAQAQLALDLLRGTTLDDIADARRVRVSTLRTQLSEILAKTNTKRQAELLALLARLPRQEGD